MRLISRLTLTGLVLAAVTLVAAPGTAHAQAEDGLNITTSPVYSTLNTKPGQTVSTDLRVQNSGNRPIKLNVELKKFQVKGSSGEAAVVDPNQNDASVGWVKFSQNTIEADPGEWTTIKMTVNVPPSAAFGYYYAVLFSAADGSIVKQVKGGSLQGSAGILVLLDVETPDSTRKLGLASFSATQRIFEFLPANFDVTVRNEGNTFSAPQGEVLISRDRKETISRLSFNSGQGNVLPETERVFRAEWTDGFPAYKEKRVNNQLVTGSDGKPERSLSWSTSDLRKIRFGRYYAHLVMVYNDGRRDVPVESVVAFWVIPWRFLLVVLVILILVLIGPIMLLRRMLRGRLGRKSTTPRVEKIARRPRPTKPPKPRSDA